MTPTNRTHDLFNPEPDMPYAIDETHDPKLESWVESANDPETDFPIQNLPLCAVESESNGIAPTLAVPIGDQVLLLDPLDNAGFFDELDLYIGYDVESVNDLEPAVRAGFRSLLSRLLRKDHPVLRDNALLRARALIDRDQVLMNMPVFVRDYTDFYASLFHATNVGTMFRPTNPLLPNYKHIPIAYHGRASTIVPSGTPVIRPIGQLAPVNPEGVGSESRPTHGPCKLLDYELEVGLVVGRGNAMGEPISIDNAEDHILGMCLVNDWSARDLQKWEYQPLGPFLAKSFATTVSPYIVTMEALAPFRSPAYQRPDGDPQPLPYLDNDHNRSYGNIDITLEVYLASEQMRTRGLSPVRLSRGSFKDMYWTIAQMVTHHTSNGCAMQPGDLLASGTVSGPTRDARGSMLELSWDGDPFANPPVIVPGTQRTPIELPTGETRKFLADGDEVIIKGYCERDGFRRIGFGACRGIIQPAR